MSNILRAYAIGDVHGDQLKLYSEITRLLGSTVAADKQSDRSLDAGDDYVQDDYAQDLSLNDNVYFMLGDVGVKYGAYENLYVLETMSILPGTFVIMRGNHDARYIRDFADDDRLGLYKENWHGGAMWRSSTYPNVLFAPDCGDVYHVNGVGVALIPGAYSVDGRFRIMNGYPFEPDEQLTYTEMSDMLDKIDRSGEDIRIVMSHTCPLRWESEISDLFIDGLPQSRIDKGTERFLDAVLDDIGEDKLIGWYFGHYHDDRTVAGGKGHMAFNVPVRIPELCSEYD